jgi:hypothetical protein
MESGFLYNGKDPIYDMDSLEFQNMLKDMGYDVDHPNDLKDISLDMWRAKWVFSLYKKNKSIFVVDEKKIIAFKNMLI